MSKVLVDRELLELLQERLDPHRDAAAWGALCDALRRAQPAEAEEVSNARLMNTLAELARRAPLRTLHTICETQHQVSTVKLERYLEPVGDTLAGYAFTLRIDFNKLSAALSAVTAERDRLRKDAERYRWLCVEGNWVARMFGKWRAHTGEYGENNPTDWFDSRDAAIDSAMAAKEA